jgi:NitT/TauT family transport system permease protein
MKNEKQISQARRSYLKALKRNNIIVWGFRILILFSFVLLWEGLTYLKIIDSFLFSSPSRIIKTICELSKQGELVNHILTTLFETIVGFLTATVLGTIISTLLWFSSRLRSVLEPYIVVLNALPKIALGPVIIIAFGAGIKSIIFMTIIVTVVVTIINMLTGFIQTDKGKILLLQSMGASKLQILTRLIIPNSIPTLISTLKVNVGLSWIGSIMGEYIVSREGLGYLIVYGGQVLKLDLVMTSTVILCLLAGLMYAIVAILERKINKWQ